jgi:hypothetical protein
MISCYCSLMVIVSGFSICVPFSVYVLSPRCWQLATPLSFSPVKIKITSHMNISWIISFSLTFSSYLLFPSTNATSQVMNIQKEGYTYITIKLTEHGKYITLIYWFKIEARQHSNVQLKTDVNSISIINIHVPHCKYVWC